MSSRRRIAVVDDNADHLYILRMYLGDICDISEYADGLQALQGLTQDQPDLIFLDISMPELDGVEVLHRLRKDNQLKDIPVYAVTAHAAAKAKEQFENLGFTGYLSKPVELTDVTDIVHRLP